MAVNHNAWRPTRSLPTALDLGRQVFFVAALFAFVCGTTVFRGRCFLCEDDDRIPPALAVIALAKVLKAWAGELLALRPSKIVRGWAWRLALPHALECLCRLRSLRMELTIELEQLIVRCGHTF